MLCPKEMAPILMMTKYIRASLFSGDEPRLEDTMAMDAVIERPAHNQTCACCAVLYTNSMHQTPASRIIIRTSATLVISRQTTSDPSTN